jgi:hypothetical protein
MNSGGMAQLICEMFRLAQSSGVLFSIAIPLGRSNVVKTSVDTREHISSKID